MVDIAPAGLDRQGRQIHEWHTKAHVMHVVHSKAAAHAELVSKGLGAAVSILAAITGTTLYTTWSDAPQRGWQIVVGSIALIGVALSAVQTSLSPGRHSAEHRAAAARYGRLRRLIEAWDLEHPGDGRPEPNVIREWRRLWLDIESSSPIVTDRELKTAEARVAAQRLPQEDPW